MNWLGLLILLTVAGLVQSIQYTCEGSCGLRVVPSVYHPTTNSYNDMSYDSGMTRVVGGTGAKPGAWPWIVSIQHPWIPGLKHLCGGSLISKQWVLTAAHCFDEVTEISKLSVVTGATQLTQPGHGAQVRSIKQVLLHQYYNHVDMSYDIALMELDHPVQCSPYIQLACVPNATLRVSELQNCWVAGWGATAARGRKSSDHLQEAKVQLINIHLCNSTFWYSGKIHTYNLCAGYPQGKIDTCQVGACQEPLSPQQHRQHRPNTAQGLLCPATQSPSQPQLTPGCSGGFPHTPHPPLPAQGSPCAKSPDSPVKVFLGDSGGPLMCQEKNSDYWWVIGITSWGRGCARARQPGIYISTQYFYDWILFYMKLSPDGSPSPTSRA
ncbi:hypothetical protein DV515_00004004, partial [Chloebia gouldiae]